MLRFCVSFYSWLALIAFWCSSLFDWLFYMKCGWYSLPVPFLLFKEWIKNLLWPKFCPLFAAYVCDFQRPFSDPKGATTAQDERSNSTEAEVKPTSSGNRTSQGNPAARTPPEDPASPFSSWLGKVGPLYPLFSALNSSSNLMAAEDQIF